VAIAAICLGSRSRWPAIFLAAFAAGWWDIAQSRSSTAGIGFVFLPGLATLAGLLGVAGVGLSLSRDRVARLLGAAAYAAAALIIAFELVDGAATIRRNRARDRAAAAQRIQPMTDRNPTPARPR